jgi:hypothetical protein
VAWELISQYQTLAVTDLSERSSTHHPRTTWYETAPRVDERHLASLRETLVEIAKEEGFPVPTPRAYIRFDQRVGEELFTRMAIMPADASNEGVWSFLSLILLPDIAVWRFPGLNARGQRDRLMGRPRNVFRRLWARSYALGAAAGQLLEDETVAIMERPTLGGDRRVARAFAEAHLVAISRHRSVSRTELMREAAKRLRRISMVVTLPALTDAQLQQLLTEIFEMSAQSGIGADIK